MARRAWPWALLLATGALLIWRPAWFAVLGAGVLVVAVIIFALLLAIYAFARYAPGRAGKAGIRIAQVSFVGQEHASSRLRVIEAPDAIRVERSRGLYALSFGALGVAGPGLIAMFLANGAASDLRHPMMIFAALFSIGLSVLLVHLLYVYLFRRPSLTMARGFVVLRQGRREIERLGRDDIAALRRETHAYLDDGDNEARCYILVAQTRDGSERRLLASGREDEIDRIAARMRSLLGLR